MATITTTIQWTDQELVVLKALDTLREAQLALNAAGDDEWRYLATDDGPYGDVGKLVRNILTELVLGLRVGWTYDDTVRLVDDILECALDSGESISYAATYVITNR